MSLPATLLLLHALGAFTQQLMLMSGSQAHLWLQDHHNSCDCSRYGMHDVHSYACCWMHML